MSSARITSRRISAVLVVALVVSLLHVVLTAAASPTAMASAPPEPLREFVWGTKPSGMIVGAFTSVEVPFWDEASGDYLYSSEPGGLLAWPRGCKDWGCWQRLTSDAADTEPAWSPSGYQVAYLHGLGSVRELRVLDTRTGDSRVIASGNSTMSRPTWSRDEQYLAWSVGMPFVDDQGDTHYNNYSLWQAPVDGTFVPSRLAHSPETVMPPCPLNVEPTSVQRANPSWSASGNLLYLRAQYAAGGDLTICNDEMPTAAFADASGLGAETGRPEAMVDYYGGIGTDLPVFLDWSPDGRRIVVTQTLGTDSTIYPAPGLTGSTVTLAGASWTTPSWAPDDKFIVVGTKLFLSSGAEWPTMVPDPAYPPESGVMMENPDGVFYQPGELTGADAQCAGTSCLSGIVATFAGTADTVARVNLGGDLTGQLDNLNRSVFRLRPSGTYVVTARVDSGDTLSALTAITCDDSNSQGDISTGTATYRVDAGELVSCQFSVNRPDQDGDGWYDDVDPCPRDPANACDSDRDGDGSKDSVDPCPDDPTNKCKDTDGDGLSDAVDPCPNDPTNKCTERCRTFNTGYEAHLGDAGGHRMFAYSLHDMRWCSNNGRVTVQSGGAPQSDKLYSPLVAALMETLGVKIKYQRSSKVSVEHFATGGARISVRGRYQYCTQIPVPVLGKGLKVLRRHLPVRVRRLVSSLGAKAVLKNPLVPKRYKVRIIVMGVEGFIRLSKLSKGEKEALVELVSLLKGLPFEKLMSAIWDGVCLPQAVWEPDISVVIDKSGTPSATETGVTAIFTVSPYRP